MRLLVSAGDADTVANANSASATVNMNGHYSIVAVYSEDDGNGGFVPPPDPGPVEP